MLGIFPRSDSEVQRAIHKIYCFKYIQKFEHRTSNENFAIFEARIQRRDIMISLAIRDHYARKICTFDLIHRCGSKIHCVRY